MATIDKISSERHEGDAVCLVCYGGLVFTGGADGKIKIWDTDLTLIKTVDAHESYIYALVVNSTGKIYSSCCDGSVKYMLPPYSNETVETLFCCEDPIQSMYCDGDILYTGDEKGVVTNWKDDRLLFKFNLVEEVKSMAIEAALIYTVRDLDVCISEVVAGKSGKYSNRAVIPGKSPLTLVGPLVSGKRTYLAFPDRTGMGLSLVTNLPRMSFAKIWDKPECHEMIVMALCGDEQYLYSGGYDRKVKGWTDLNNGTAGPKSLGEVTVGCCVNALCCGARSADDGGRDNNYVYIAASDGLIRRAKFI